MKKEKRGFMFPFDADCSDCRYMNPDDQKDGKFYCKKKNEYVSANARRCAMAAEVMGRPNCDKKIWRDISKAHGYYVVTAITEILNLPIDNEYMESFIYLRDVICSSSDEYASFIDDYETCGKELADLLRGDEDAHNYAEYLRSTYLNGVVSFFCQDAIQESIALYSRMLDTMKERYSYRREDIKIKEK